MDYLDSVLLADSGFERLDDDAIPKDSPMPLFQSWLGKVLEDDLLLSGSNVFTLSTASESGIPSCKSVVLRSVSGEELRFGVSLGAETENISRNPHVVLHFQWSSRSVVVHAKAKPAAAATSDLLWEQLPVVDQIATSAFCKARGSGGDDVSASGVAAVTRCVETEFEAVSGREYIPRPEGWAAYSATPFRVEFVNGGHPSHCDDRLVYERSDAGGGADTAEDDTGRSQSSPGVWNSSRKFPSL